MIRYIGKRELLGVCRVTVEGTGEPRPLGARLDLRCHSPAGFEWGYGGSGPAQLALALLADALGDEKRAEALHQLYKSEVVVGLPEEGWSLPRAAVLSWVSQAERRR